mmetsp:Transcript_28762/g.92824  ORF Transcript_28762/g.92824 Transcript_28762/m.92824 type:complete len:368 (-) Transcript_28762:95-1198(-)
MKNVLLVQGDHAGGHLEEDVEQQRLLLLSIRAEDSPMLLGKHVERPELGELSHKKALVVPPRGPAEPDKVRVPREPLKYSLLVLALPLPHQQYRHVLPVQDPSVHRLVLSCPDAGALELVRLSKRERRTVSELLKAQILTALDGTGDVEQETVRDHKLKAATVAVEHPPPLLDGVPEREVGQEILVGKLLSSQGAATASGQPLMDQLPLVRVPVSCQNRIAHDIEGERAAEGVRDLRLLPSLPLPQVLVTSSSSSRSLPVRLSSSTPPLLTSSLHLLEDPFVDQLLFQHPCLRYLLIFCHRIALLPPSSRLLPSDLVLVSLAAGETSVLDLLQPSRSLPAVTTPIPLTRKQPLRLAIDDEVPDERQG